MDLCVFHPGQGTEHYLPARRVDLKLAFTLGVLAEHCLDHRENTRGFYGKAHTGC